MSRIDEEIIALGQGPVESPLRGQVISQGAGEGVRYVKHPLLHAIQVDLEGCGKCLEPVAAATVDELDMRLT